MKLCKDCKHFSEEHDGSRASQCGNLVLPVIHLCNRRLSTIDPVMGGEVRNTSTCRSERAVPVPACGSLCGLEGQYWVAR